MLDGVLSPLEERFFFFRDFFGEFMTVVQSFMDFFKP